MTSTDATRRQRGQALTEFALVAPILLLILLGLIDLSRFVFTANALNNSAREAARFASVAVRPAECASQSRSQCATTIARSHAWGVPSSDLNVVVTCERAAPNGTITSVAVTSCRTDDLLVVRTQLEFTLLTPVIAQFLGDQTLSSEVRVTVNQ